MNPYQLIDQYIQSGESKLLVYTLETIVITDLNDFVSYAYDVIKRVIDSGKFTDGNIRRIVTTVENRKKTHVRISQLDLLKESIKTNQFDKYIEVLTLMKQYGFVDMIPTIIRTWYSCHIEDFNYIHKLLIGDSANIFEWLNAFVALVRLSSVTIAIDFLAHYGYDIAILHLNSEISSCLMTPMDYDDVFGDWDEEILDEICDYFRTSQTRPQLLIQVILTHWVCEYYTIVDMQMINELYESLDKESRSSLIRSAIYAVNITHIEYASKYGLIELDPTTLELILNRLTQIKSMDIILDKTDFLEKIMNLSTSSELYNNSVVKIINRIKN